MKAVLDGISDWVKSFALEPGDLQLFKGLYSLNRVSPLKAVDAALCGDPVLCRTARYGGNAQTPKTALWPCFANPSRTRRFAG